MATPQYLEIFVDQKVTADEIEVAQFAVQFGLDRQETLQHDFLHSLLKDTGCRHVLERSGSPFQNGFCEGSHSRQNEAQKVNRKKCN